MDDLLQQMEVYRTHASNMGYGHYQAGKHTARKHRLLGLPIMITTTVVGTSIFATVSTNPSLIWKIIAGLISLTAAVLASIQTFFNFQEQSQKHKEAGVRYGILRRDIDLYMLKYANANQSARDQALADLKTIADRLGQLAEESPDLADSFYEQAERRFAKSPTAQLADNE